MGQSFYNWCMENNRKDLLDQWDYEKNTDVRPIDVSHGSSKKVWWNCRKNHSWYRAITNRKRRGCPYCSNMQVLQGYNDFITWCENNKKQDLLVQWDYIKNEDILPQNVVFGFRYPVWWKCQGGHSWKAKIKERIGENGNVRSCPTCRGVLVVEGDKKLSSVAPELLNEWDYNKNKNNPDDYTYGSNEKVWWKCQVCGNEWKTRISHRVHHHGCKKCESIKNAQKLSKPDVGCSLLDVNFTLAQEWHPFKNGELKPSDVMPNSRKKVWWLCPTCGHDWQAVLAQRNNNAGCPKCMDKQRRITLKKHNIAKQGSLADNFPALIKEWHPTKNSNLIPQNFIGGSEEKIWWQCSRCGHEWQNTIVKRTKRNQGCPECKKELKVSFNEKAVYYYISSCFSDAVENYKTDWLDKQEIDIYIPELKLGIEYDGETYHKDFIRDKGKNKLCKENNVVLLRIREPKCPELNDTSFDFKLTSRKEADLKKCLEMIIKYINDVYYLNLETDINISKDRNKIYDLMHLQFKENSLQAVNPELAKEWHTSKNYPLTPDKVTKNSSKKVWWLCTLCGREWDATVGSRNSGVGCTCTSKERQAKGLIRHMVKKHGSLSANNPMLAKEWHPTKNGELLPSMLTSNSNKKVWWLCPTCGYEWETRINSRNRGSGCSACSGFAVKKGFNDLATVNPELAKEWHPIKNGDLKPTDITKGSHKKVWWLCPTCGHDWQATVGSRNKNNGCPSCAIKQRIITYRKHNIENHGSLADNCPELAKGWHPIKNGDLKPTDITKGSHKKVWWLCPTCGHDWETEIINRSKNNGSGCPLCRRNK